MPSIPIDRYDLRGIVELIEGIGDVLEGVPVDIGEFTVYYDGEPLGVVDQNLEFRAKDTDED